MTTSALDVTPDRAGAARREGALLLHPGALGDVLLAVPALRALRTAVAPELVTLAAEPRLARLVHALGEADAALPLDALGVGALFAGEALPTDSPLSRARRVVSFLGARDPAFAARMTAAAPRVDVAPSTPTDGLVWQHLVRTIDTDAAPSLAPVDVPAVLCADGAALLTRTGWDGRTPLAIVHPGAGGDAKRWAVDKFTRLIETLAERGMAIAIHEGPADARAVAAVTATTRVRLAVLHEPPLPALAGALKSAAVYIGNDSGISHLAATIGAPSIVLFTTAMRSWRPWSAAPTIVSIDPRHDDDTSFARVLHAIDATLAR